jgi:hypothetical protein
MVQYACLHSQSGPCLIVDSLLKGIGEDQLKIAFVYSQAEIAAG